ncbi:MAG: Bifunctional protein FolD [Berkelbacteria bacterium GW2011_GWA2_35_9]|uniref:Bifunctional protein FolD n=1 Tax=Berkelbacteria bacterium GW2011_GWA2_35_9 TaxID=1618333 RepID=A0A0G0FNA9_9BACT|nr:MAG: Bifunctional protein FolD [Berkelbacteria bacterium GW2011_GWA2_35_9]
MKIIKGDKIANEIIKELTVEVKMLPSDPGLAVILIGDDKQSRKYIEIKQKIAEKIGVNFKLFEFPENIEISNIVYLIDELNKNKSVNGIIVQMPIPNNLDRLKIIWAIDPKKDVDGFRMHLFRPPTPMAIINLLLHNKIDIYHKKFVIVGYGFLIGRPLATLLKKQGAFVNITEKNDRDYRSKILEAEIVIGASGSHKFIQPNLVSKNQIVIDASGVDTDFEKIKSLVRAIVPPIGGIGPLTVANLFSNLIKAYNIQNEI